MGGHVMNLRYISISVFIFTILFVSTTIFGQNDTSPSIAQIISNGSPQEVQAAVTKNQDINAKINDLGWTALHAAVNFRRDGIVDLLINLKANINAQDNTGQTPLLLAIETGQNDAIEYLVSKGADVNIANNNGDNPLSMSKKIGLNAISDYLVEHNAKLPVQGIQNQVNRGNRSNMPQGRGVNQSSDGTFGQRGMRGMNTNTDFMNNQMNQNMQPPVITENITIPAETTINTKVSEKLDPNEVQARIKKYPGLQEQVAEIIDGRRAELRQWERTDNDNRTSLISTIRRQYGVEVDFIKKIATEEKAQKTIELADKLNNSRKDAFIAINREVRDNASSSTRTTTSSRRSSRSTVTTTRSNRRGSNTTIPETTITTNESKYSPEIQKEVDVWLNSDVLNISGRKSLMEQVNDTLVSEINSLKQTAISENAEKTVAAIDGILLARQIVLDDLNKAFQGALNEQVIPSMENMPELQNIPGSENQDAVTGRRGMRGR